VLATIGAAGRRDGCAAGADLEDGTAGETASVFCIAAVWALAFAAARIAACFGPVRICDCAAALDGVATPKANASPITATKLAVREADVLTQASGRPPL